MAKKEDSESETSNKSGSEELGAPENGLTDYEKQRQRRIKDNQARLEALGLRKLASSLMGSPQNNNRRDKRGKGKLKAGEDDEEYKPNEDDDAYENEKSASSEDSEYDEEVANHRRSSRSRSRKVKNKKSTPKKKHSSKNLDNPNVMDEDEALMQAIALSLEDSKGVSAMTADDSNAGAANVNGRKGRGCLLEDAGRRKRRKPSTGRVQMTEDDVVIHFCQLDEFGKGSITLRDLRRMAAAHDFTWTDKELADMICYFDSDGDGKLSLDDFRSIVSRCNMLRGPDDT